MLMEFLQLYLYAALFILAFMTTIWLLSLLLRDSSIVDIFWGIGLGLTAWLYFFLTPQGYALRKWLLAGLVSIWALRLSIYILRRNWGKGEDFRYRAWREEAGRTWWWYSFFKVFLLQGALMWIISAPLLMAQFRPTPARLTALDILGIGLWLIGFSFETLGDWQMARFKADPSNKGKVLSQGVWRYSRHPNYFGEATLWWGHAMFAAAVPAGVWTLFSPILMTLLLLRVSGVTLLESSLKETKPGYAEYIETTSAFIPWPPRKRLVDS